MITTPTSHSSNTNISKPLHESTSITVHLPSMLTKLMTIVTATVMPVKE